MKYILASGSPRRKELLALLGIGYTIMKAWGEEIRTGDSPAEIVENLSKQKAMEVAERIVREGTGNQKSADSEEQFIENSSEPVMIFGADTLVAKGNEIFGKPKDSVDAFGMLSKLQDTEHQVYTGVTVAIVEKGVISTFTFHERTDVSFYPISKEEIDAYLSTGEHEDKAGAYAIQGIFGKHVKGIRGDYNNVVGLPVARLYQELRARKLM